MAWRRRHDAARLLVALSRAKRRRAVAIALVVAALAAAAAHVTPTQWDYGAASGLAAVLVAEAAPAEVHIGMLMSETLDPCEPLGAALTLERINSDASILPHTVLVPRRIDTRRQARGAMQGALALLCATNASRPATDEMVVNANDCRSSDIIFGCSWSPPSIVGEYVARTFVTPMLSPTAAASDLDSDVEAPTFSRTYLSATYAGAAVSKVVQYYGWEKVNLVYTRYPMINDMARTFERVSPSGMPVNVRELSDPPTDVELQNAVDVLATSKVFVAVLMIHQVERLTKMMELGRNAGIFGPNWAIIVWSHDVARTMDREQESLTPEQLEMLQGVLLVADEGVREGTPAYNTLLAEWAARPRSDADLCQEDTPAHYPAYASDGMLFLATALHNLFLTAPYSAASYTQFPPLDVVQAALRNTTVVGASGKIELDAFGNRRSEIRLVNVRGTSVASQEPLAIVARLHPNEGFNLADAALQGNLEAVSDEPVIWPGGSTMVPIGEGSPYPLADSTGVFVAVLGWFTVALAALLAAGVLKYRAAPLLVWSGKKALASAIVGAVAGGVAVLLDLRATVAGYFVSIGDCERTENAVVLSWVFVNAILASKAYRFRRSRAMTQLHAVPKRPTGFTRGFAVVAVVGLVWLLLQMEARPVTSTDVEGTPGGSSEQALPLHTVSDPNSDRVYLMRSCSSANLTPVHSLCVVIVSALELLGTVWAFNVRTMPAGFDEARYVLVAYCGVLTGRLLLLPATVLVGTEPKAALIFRSLSVLLPVWSLLGAVVGTRVFACYMEKPVDYLVRRGGGAANPAIQVRTMDNPLQITLHAPPPESWAPQRDNCIVVSLKAADPEFEEVAKLLWESLPTVHVLRVERIQNLYTWQRYSQERARLASRNGEHGVNEKQLWHGTGKLDPAAVYDGLETAGFDVRMTGAGNFYGRGAYFAERAAYADAAYTYDPPDEIGVRQVLLAQVLTGISKSYGKSKDRTLKRPPLRQDGGAGDLYDSVNGGPHTGGPLRDDWRATKMYVIYNTAQAYPAYKVTYKPPGSRRLTSARGSFVQQRDPAVLEGLAPPKRASMRVGTGAGAGTPTSPKGRGDVTSPRSSGGGSGGGAAATGGGGEGSGGSASTPRATNGGVAAGSNPLSSPAVP